MIYEYLKTAFPIYDRLDKQNRFIKKVDNSSGYLLIAPQDTLLPFMFTVPTLSPNVIEEYQVINVLTGAVAYDIIGSYTPNFTMVKTSLGLTYIMHKGLSLGALFMMPGNYYVRLKVDGLFYYSELFQVNCFDIDDQDTQFTRLEWDNDNCDLGNIMYQTGFKNIVFLESDIEKEDPQIEEEGFTDGLNNFFPTLQKYVDNLSLQASVSFYLADALVLMSMHKKVVITLPESVYSSEIRNIKATAAAQDGNFAYYNFVMKFQQDTQYINSACCNNMTIVV